MDAGGAGTDVAGGGGAGDRRDGGGDWDGHFAFFPALAALVGALLLQIGANFANDLFDFLRGADTAERVGPMRVTQAGLLAPRQVRAGMCVVFGAAALIGVYLRGRRLAGRPDRR